MIKRLPVLVEKPKLTKTRISRCFKMCQWFLTHHHRMLKHKANLLNHRLQPIKRWNLKTGDIPCWAHWACMINSMVLILRSLCFLPCPAEFWVCEWSPSEQAHSREDSVTKRCGQVKNCRERGTLTALLPQLGVLPSLHSHNDNELWPTCFYKLHLSFCGRLGLLTHHGGMLWSSRA